MITSFFLRISHAEGTKLSELPKYSYKNWEITVIDFALKTIHPKTNQKGSRKTAFSMVGVTGFST